MQIRCTKHGDWDTDWVTVNVCPHCYAEELVGPIKRCPVHHKDFTEASCPECVEESTSRLLQNWKERVETAVAEEFDLNGKALRSGYGIVETDAEGTPMLLPSQWYCRMHGIYEPPVDGPSAYVGYGYHRVACPLCAAAGVQVQLDAEKKVCEPLGGLNGALKTSLEFDPNGKKASQLGDCLDEAKKTICGERQDVYGSPEDSFAIIAQYWNTYLTKGSRIIKGPLDAKDVAHMMVLFKMARVQGQAPNRDNYVDLCGYAAIAADRLMGGNK